jgi:hypothetical protein
MPPQSEDQDFGPKGHHPVLAAVSRGCPRAQGRFPRVTHPSATIPRAEALRTVRLACVRRAASVRSEPGSNSQLQPPSHKGTGSISAHDITAQGRPQAHLTPRPRAAQRRPGAHPAPAPRRPSPQTEKNLSQRNTPARGPGATSAPATLARMPEPATPKPPPTHPFLVPTCPKTNPAHAATQRRLALPGNAAL